MDYPLVNFILRPADELLKKCDTPKLSEQSVVAKSYRILWIMKGKELKTQVKVICVVTFVNQNPIFLQSCVSVLSVCVHSANKTLYPFRCSVSALSEHILV